MKQLCRNGFCVFMVLLLLSACGAAQPADFKPETVAESVAAPIALSLKSASDGSNSGALTENAYYSVSPLEDGAFQMTGCDFAAGTQAVLCNVPNCAHRDASCPAWVEPGHGGSTVISMVDRLVYIFQGSPINGVQTTFTPCIITMEQTGENRETILKLPSNEALVPPFASDGENLYCLSINRAADARGEQAILKIGLADGTCEKLYSFQNQSLSLIGAFDEYLILKETTFPLQSNSPQFHLELFSVRDGSFSTLRSWESGQEQSLAHKEKCYFAVASNNRLLELNCRTREMREFSTPLPIPASLGFDSFSFVTAYDDMLVFEIYDPGEEPKDAETFRYGFNTLTGERKELTLQTTYDGVSEPIRILAENQNALLVASALEERMQRLLNTNGSTSTVQTIGEVYSILSKEDYFNSVANYQPLPASP